MRVPILSVLLVTIMTDGVFSWLSESNRKLEEVLMKNYNRKHRPVKKDSTTMQVQVYLLIGHVEKVDEHEQTMLLHGLLWATWTDEYLQWDPSKFNNTRRFTVESWKIWQPALSLYNNARGNGWHLHMGGLPASIGFDGKVWASGSFSFFVTCLFDFSDYPYDEQECPIVIADWVYDLSKVNLSDPAGSTPFNKPTVKLSYDPLNNVDKKKHVAGWEVQDTWRRHCYWGSTYGCKDEIPQGQPEWHWSILEFGVKIKRHAPYYGLTVILPTVITSVLTLAVFWIDTPMLAIAVTVFNILLQGLFGWDLVRALPPGSGTVPKIVSLYGFNLSLTMIAFILHVIISYLEYIIPENFAFPFQITNFTDRLREMSPFKLKGLSFDPQKLLMGEISESDISRGKDDIPDSPPDVTTSDDAEHLEERAQRNGETSISLQERQQQKTGSDATPAGSCSHVGAQLYVFRRIFFFLYLIMYVITLPICLL